MKQSPKVAASLPDEELARPLATVRQAESVELKATIANVHHFQVFRALDLDPIDAKIRQVFYFDTPELALYGGDVVVRARRTQGRGDDTVIKLRPIEPGSLPEKLRESRAFGVEVDALPGGTYARHWSPLPVN